MIPHFAPFVFKRVPQTHIVISPLDRHVHGDYEHRNYNPEAVYEQNKVREAYGPFDQNMYNKNYMNGSLYINNGENENKKNYVRTSYSDNRFDYSKTNDENRGENKEYRDYSVDKDEPLHKKKNLWKKATDTVKELFDGFSFIKVTTLVVLAFVAVGIGYQIRKKEEHSNYVRLPATQ
ncbi:hypothetical protein COBT_001397 [Conglomerata obtusa]